MRADAASLFADAPVEAERLRIGANGGSTAYGGHVLYWMQKAQRSGDNPALDFAVHAAKKLGLPLLVLFVLTDYPAASPIHCRFMLRGLAECAADLRGRGAGFSIRRGSPPETVAGAARGAALVVADEGRLRIERRWRDSLAAILSGDRADSPTNGEVAFPGNPPPFVIVETEAVVPPDTASMREEWSAATIRPRISARLPFFLGEPKRSESLSHAFPRNREESDDSLFTAFDQPFSPAYAGDRAPFQRIGFIPGRRAGMARFLDFIESGKLARYGEARNDPGADGQSGMSPYLHFGQVSPVRLAFLALRHPGQGSQAFVEQAVVRRELSANFVLRNPAYDSYDGAVPTWAREALSAVAGRTTAYGQAELEAGRTDDRFWNAAQNEMAITGKMHGYMRMYWGKRLLAWHEDPSEAFGTAIRLNDRYSLDGRDPNGYAGIAWCFGRHDRPWPRRPLFGSVRSMVPAGLERKFDAAAYAARIESLYNTPLEAR